MEELETRLCDLLGSRTPGLMEVRHKCAVFVPLVKKGREYSLLYEVRSGSLRRQPNEVCFPGGGMEPGEGPVDCALRETEEELGLSREQITLLGELDVLVHRGSTVLYPVLGLVEFEALSELEINPDEVEEVFLVPLRHLLTTQPEVYHYPLVPQPEEDFPYEKLGISRDYSWIPGYESGPIWPWEGRTIWGLTGKITRHLLDLIRE